MTKAEFCSNEFPIARFMCTLKKSCKWFYGNYNELAMKFTRKDNVFCLSICCPQRKAL